MIPHAEVALAWQVERRALAAIDLGCLVGIERTVVQQVHHSPDAAHDTAVVFHDGAPLSSHDMFAEASEGADNELVELHNVAGAEVVVLPLEVRVVPRW